MNSHLFPVNQSIEAIFAPTNLDEDCSRIGQLMTPVENAIDQDLCDGQYENAVQMFLRLVDSMCYHFVADEHWCWFDDMYDPGYALDLCWGGIRDNLVEFPDALRIELEKGLVALSETEAYSRYGYPDIGRWLEEM